MLYELTNAGRELAEAILPLAVWGPRHQMDDADVDREALRAEWVLGFLVAGGDVVSTDNDGVYEFRIDDSVACLRVHNGRLSVQTGSCARVGGRRRPDDSQGRLRDRGQRTTVTEAITDGQVASEGDPVAVARLAAIVDERISSRMSA